MLPVWEDIPSQGQFVERPASLHWSQTTTTTTTTTATATATAYNCTTTNVHHQSSLHVRWEVLWNVTISICGRKHLDPLSTALHLRPPMKTFQDKHRAYKFEVAITIVCHKAVESSVVTQPPVMLTSEVIAVYAADATQPLDDVNRQLLNFIEVFELNGSEWVFSHFQDLQLTLRQLGPLRGSAYIPLPRWIQTRRAVVNVAVTGDDCSRGSYWLACTR